MTAPMTPSQGKQGCGPAALVVILVFLVLGVIGQACEGDDPDYGRAGDTECVNAAAASEIRGNNFDSEYQACIQMKEIIGD